MLWKQITKFEHFTPKELYSVLKLRQDVFIVEQKCIYNDMDSLDIQSRHLLLFSEDKLAGCARIVPAGLKFDVPSIGRIAVYPQYRKKGFGAEIVEKSLEMIKNLNPGPVKIEAQLYLQDFYESLGFTRESSHAYNVDGILHIEMITNT